jgi:tetratricopeptide (TPR) repeat protein
VIGCRRHNKLDSFARPPGCKALVLLALVTLPCVASVAFGATPNPDRQSEIVQRALESYDQAVAASRDEPSSAAALYRKSAYAFETLRAAGFSNTAVYYDLGNAYFRLGELGRAVLNYRRAERLSPTDAAVAMNLKYARDRVEPYISPTGGSRLLDRLMFWNRHTSIWQRFLVAAIGSLAGWLLLTLRLWMRSRGLVVTAIILIVLGVANAASVGWQIRTENRRPAAVVVKGEHTLRLGRGEGYDPAITQPLGPGVETRILNERGGWCEVELADGKTGWLPAEALERV